MIHPKDIIKKHSVAELIETANQYYQSISDPSEQLAKPFNNLLEAPHTLKSMGEILRGLNLGKTMTVLDFGSGTSWSSKYLNELQCRTISCDASEEALRLGKYLFEKHGLIRQPVGEPQFLLFDGYTIDLPDCSVDRIICFDSFHHIPNQEDVLSEFARVLNPGGIAGFSEPGRYHSQTAMSQSEMQNYRVLENDIILQDIFKIASRFGFTKMLMNIQNNLQFTLKDIELLEKENRPTEQKILNDVKQTILDRNVFFLHKGEPVFDSRNHHGLAHQLSSKASNLKIEKNKKLNITLNIKNTGEAIWLKENIQNIGVVNLGIHLYHTNCDLINLDFARHSLKESLKPGESIEEEIVLQFKEEGSYILAIDMVAEDICWFENIGSKPVKINLEVT